MISLDGLVSEGEKYDILTKTLLTENQYYSIASTGKGDDKLTYLALNAAVVDFLLRNGFNGSHVLHILVGAGWGISLIGWLLILRLCLSLKDLLLHKVQ